MEGQTENALDAPQAHLEDAHRSSDIEMPTFGDNSDTSIGHHKEHPDGPTTAEPEVQDLEQHIQRRQVNNPGELEEKPP